MNKSVRDENGLNKRERAILKYIQKEISIKGYAPSVREICKAVNLSSTATVQGYLNKLEEKGFITPREAENVCNRSSATVRRYLGILTAVGIVQAEGNTNNSIYRFVAN